MEYESGGILPQIRGGNFSVNFVHKNGRIVLKSRTWDGIDRPDHTDILWMNPAEAESKIAELRQVIVEANKWLADKAKADRPKKETEIAQLRHRLKILEEGLDHP